MNSKYFQSDKLSHFFCMDFVLLSAGTPIETSGAHWRVSRPGQKSKRVR
jgi:hypothetical protein